MLRLLKSPPYGMSVPNSVDDEDLPCSSHNEGRGTGGTWTWQQAQRFFINFGNSITWANGTGYSGGSYQPFLWYSLETGNGVTSNSSGVSHQSGGNGYGRAVHQSPDDLEYEISPPSDEPRPRITLTEQMQSSTLKSLNVINMGIENGSFSERERGNVATNGGGDWDGTIPKGWEVIGGGVSFDGVLAYRAGIAGEIGTYSIHGEDYIYDSKGIALGKEVSIGANMFIIIGDPSLTSADFAGFAVTGSYNIGYSGWSIGWSPAGYIVIKGGLGLGFGGSVVEGATVVSPAPDLYKGTEFEGSPYGPVP